MYVCEDWGSRGGEEKNHRRRKLKESVWKSVVSKWMKVEQRTRLPLCLLGGIMLLQCFGWALADHPPEPPQHTHIHTHTLPCQTLEIPHIPSTSLTALQPRRDNKGMGRHWIPACSADSETFSFLIGSTGHHTLSRPSPHRDVTDCPANEMECTVPLNEPPARLTC